MGRVIRLVAVAVVGTLMLAACQREEQAPVTPASDPSPQVVNPGTLAAGQQVSVPKGEVVLTMSGTIGNHNKGRKLALARDGSSAGAAAHSSLSYLRRFPIDMLKIDKAFVDGIGGGRQDATLAHAIINLSHTQELHTIAEGIELPERAASLAALGCHHGQGYHFARPLPVEAMTELLERALAPGGFLLAATGAVTT